MKIKQKMFHALLTMLMIVAPLQIASADEPMTVHFIDVGQGLAILAQSNGQNLVYDGGEHGEDVVTYLQEQGVEIVDYMISSHYDSDHLAGLVDCLNAFQVNHVIGSDYVHDSNLYDAFMDAVAAEGLSVEYPAVGDTFQFGSGSFTILAPDGIRANDSNNNSVAIKLDNSDDSFIFTGDAEESSEQDMIRPGVDLTCDVLCLGHHGSASSTSWDFLSATDPEYAVISSGSGNQYGHPAAETMSRLSDTGVSVFRTDKQGTIIAYSDGDGVTWNVDPCNDYSSGDYGSTDQTAAATTYYATDNINVRSAASTDAEIVGAYHAGDSVEVYSISDGWASISYNSDMAYVSAQYLSNTIPQTEAPAPEETPSEAYVWLSATGEKYHSIPNCGRMNPDKARQVPLSDAESMGYPPCSKCF